jgi:urocanate hydratase
MVRSAGPREVHPATGLELRCRGWRQEGLLRLLENTVHNGERPEELIIYGGTGQAARNWDCFETIVECLLDLEDDETLVIQSGKPVARFRGSVDSPRVVTANTNLVGRWATWDTFRELKGRNLISYGQYTAGAWQFIGQQGLVQSTFETLAACAREHFDDQLRGRLVVTAGLGAMGGAQPLAITLNRGVGLICEVDEERVDRRIAGKYLDEKTADLEEAIARALEAKEAGVARSIAIVGNAAELLPRMLELGVRPDVVTDQTSAHDALYGYVPAGLTLAEANDLRELDPDAYEARSYESIVRHVKAMAEFESSGAVVFEYGNAIREQAARGGFEDAEKLGGFVAMFIRPAFCIGRGACRWIALSGDEADITAIDKAILEEFADDDSVTDWIRVAMENVPHQGLPARTTWFNYSQRARFGSMVNGMVASGEVSAPVAMTRDHLDSGSVAQPTRETEGMLDGTDAVADWPILNALLNASGGADLVAVHQGGGSGMGGSISAGATVIFDGTERAQRMLDRVLRTDPGIGVIRHADAGYESALKVIQESDLVAPMLEAGGTDE